MDDFTIWQTLVQTAVVGAGRASLPPPLLEELSARGIDIYAPAEEVLLSAAALIRQRLRAGQVLPQRAEPLAQPVSFVQGVVNPSASRFLSVMLSGKYAEALPEWLELFSRSSLSLPPESLPGLLSRCVADPDLRVMLEPYLDDRARWLIAQNPAWADMEKPLPGEQKLLEKQENPDATIELAFNSPHPWSETLSREWVKELQKKLSGAGGAGWDLFPYRDFLRKLAFKAPPIEEAPWMGGWEYISPEYLHYWKDDIDYFLRVLKFRIDMHKAFQ